MNNKSHRRVKITRSLVAILVIVGMCFGLTSFPAKAGELTISVNISTSINGNNATLTCNVSGPPSGATITYQWYKDGSKLNGKTAKSITVSRVDEPGEYKCNVEVTVKETYALINDGYVAFFT